MICAKEHKKTALARGLTLVLVFLCFLAFFPQTAEATVHKAYPKSSRSLEDWFGCSSDVVKHLSRHTGDRYYLYSRYTGLSSRYGNKPSFYACPNGRDGKGGHMNCTGFVAGVFRTCGGDLRRIKKLRHGSYANGSNWYHSLAKAKIRSYRFSNLKKALSSGKLRRGDMLYFEPKSWNVKGADCHLAFYWSDNSRKGIIWHSLGFGKKTYKGRLPGNAISKIPKKLKNHWVFIFRTSLKGNLLFDQKYSKNTNNRIARGLTDLYSLKGSVFGLYKTKKAAASANISSKGKYVALFKTRDLRGRTATKQIREGTYYYKMLKASKGMRADTKVRRIKIRCGRTAKKPFSTRALTASAANTLLKTVSREDGSGIPGVIYRVNYYSNRKGKTTGKVRRTWYIRTGNSGNVIISPEYRAKGYSSDSFFRNSSGTVRLPLGTYTFRQVSVPDGYVLNDNTSKGVIRPDKKQLKTVLFCTTVKNDKHPVDPDEDDENSGKEQ